MDTAEIGKRTRQENRRLTWLAVKQNKASYLMIAPFMLFFLVFTIVPVLMSLPMGFTDFNMVQMPKFIGLSNYTTLFLADKVFIQSIRVTLVFALYTGPISYVLCFLLAWLINELHPKLRTIFTLIFYAPSMANVYTVWKLIFSGDSYGMLNSLLADATARVQPPTDKGRRLKIYYMTQAGIRPPHFVCFCHDAKLFHFSYQRYLENQIRSTFGLEGTPIRLTIRQRGDKED